MQGVMALWYAFVDEEFIGIRGAFNMMANFFKGVVPQIDEGIDLVRYNLKKTVEWTSDQVDIALRKKMRAKVPSLFTLSNAVQSNSSTLMVS